MERIRPAQVVNRNGPISSVAVQAEADILLKGAKPADLPARADMRALKMDAGFDPEPT